MTDTTSALTALHDALTAGRHGDELRELFTPDATTTEHPNALNRGRTSTLAEMLAASEAGAGLLAWQRYDVHSLISHGTTAIARLTWTGEVARDAGAFHEGQRLTAHIAQFVEVEGGRIRSIETYDCYEAF